MEIIDSKMTYKAPTVKVVKVNVPGVLCFSGDTSNEEYTNKNNPDWF